MKFFYGIIFGGLILIIGGALDDKFNLPPKVLWLFPALASLIVVWSGIGVGITQISNPFGSPIFIGYNLSLVTFNLSLSAVLVWLWMLGMIFTTKLLDGLDGLCSGVGLDWRADDVCLIAHLQSQPANYRQHCHNFCGQLAGIFVYNFNPASIFLGEGGSTFVGFMLGVLLIILGAKIATALLVMAFYTRRGLGYHAQADIIAVPLKATASTCIFVCSTSA